MSIPLLGLLLQPWVQRRVAVTPDTKNSDSSRVSRRTLLQAGGGLALSAIGEKLVNASPSTATDVECDAITASDPRRRGVWPRTVFRRYLVDTHIPDWDPIFLSHFDAKEFVRSMVVGGAQSLMFYANSHVGLCLYHTKVGQMHANMHGRDFFGEVVTECRLRKLHPIGYFSLIYDNLNYQNHPDWRILPEDGYDQNLEGRSGQVCPNSPYRDYALACAREIATKYDIEGMFYDMTFWPSVCYCPHCTRRFWEEHGAEPPRIVDWNDPLWRSFQKARQSWLLEFAEAITNTTKASRPGITVCHQFATIFHNWSLGQPLAITKVCDYLGGDFYGGPAQKSLVCKAYNGLNQNRPFELMTSRTRSGKDQVTEKPLDELRTESFVASLHSAALLLIDYINIDGTLNPKVYSLLRKLAEERTRYEPFLGGDLVAYVAIYYDKESMYNPNENGVHVAELNAIDTCPHRDAVVGAANILREGHVPFEIVTNENLHSLDRYRAVILPSVLELTAGQAEQFRNFVDGGGALYASGPSSLDRFHKPVPRFLLEDVLGVLYQGKSGTRMTYITPADAEMNQIIWPQDHLGYPGAMIKAKALPHATVVAHITLPFVSPDLGRAIGSRFAAFWTDPPALNHLPNPAVVTNSYGRGETVWVAAPIEATAEPVNRKFLLYLLRRAFRGPFSFEVDTNPNVEVTLFHQPDRRRLLVGALNLSPIWPQAPQTALVRVLIPKHQRAKKVLQLPEGKPIPFTMTKSYAEFRLDSFHSLSMAIVDY